MFSIFRHFSQWFIAGLLALLPLIITVAVIVWVVDFAAGIFGPSTPIGGMVRRLGVSFAPNSTIPYLLGTIAVLFVILCVGMVVRSGARTYWHKFVDGLFKRIPLVGHLYATSQQVVGMLDTKEQGDLKKMKPVFCEFGGGGGCGFLALKVSGTPCRLHDRDYLIVMIPTAPVPFGGALLFVPVENVKDAGMDVDGLMSIYVSMGLTGSEFLAPGAAMACPTPTPQPAPTS